MSPWVKLTWNSFSWLRASVKTVTQTSGTGTTEAFMNVTVRQKQRTILPYISPPPPRRSCCQHWAGMWSFDPLPYTRYRAGLGNPPHCSVWAENVTLQPPSACMWLPNTNRAGFFCFFCKLAFPFFWPKAAGGWWLNDFILQDGGGSPLTAVVIRSGDEKKLLCHHL